MYITKKDAEKILDVMNKFPEDTVYRLAMDNSSGIGSTMTLTVETTVEGLAGKFTVEISGVENW
jgi:hypothetical protein